MFSSNSIQIYNGEGASSICVNAWKREIKELADDRLYKIDDFNQSYNSGFERGNVAMVIIPGGNAVLMVESCEGLAGKINIAVGDKSSFLGSCAGALITGSFVNLMIGKTCTKFNKTCTQFNINPVPYNTKYYMPHSSSVADPLNRSAVDVEWYSSSGHFQSSICKLYHAFGPAFPLETIPSEIQFNCRSLAKYITEGTHLKSQHPSAAILYRPSGNSSTPRLFTGIHPEIGRDDVLSGDFSKAFDSPNHPHITTLANMLEGSEQIRKEMCRSWLLELGIALKNNK